MTYPVVLTDEARDDLVRLERFLVGAAIDTGDFDLPLRAVDAIMAEFALLERNPFTCRKTGSDPLERELIIPFGRSGHVALFHIDATRVLISAVRHQREDDYH